MPNNILEQELAKLIFGSLGIVPGNHFGKIGLVHSDLLSDKTIRVEVGSEIKDCPVWGGLINQLSGTLTALLINFGNSDDLDLVLLSEASQGNNSNIFGIKFSWSNSDDTEIPIFCQKVQDKWIPLSLLQKLQIAEVFETIAQEGMLWQPCGSIDKLYEILVSLVEHENN